MLGERFSLVTLGSPLAASRELIGLILVVCSIIDWEGFSTYGC